jgi:hypothetical protein
MGELVKEIGNRGCITEKEQKNNFRRTDTQRTVAGCFRTKVPERKRMMVSTYEKAVKGLPEKVYKRRDASKGITCGDVRDISGIVRSYSQERSLAIVRNRQPR